jgi:hypothetical protein
MNNLPGKRIAITKSGKKSGVNQREARVYLDLR